MYKILQKIDKKDDILYQCFLRLLQYIVSTQLSSSDTYFITKYDYKFFAVDFQIFVVLQRVELDSCIYVIKILFNLNPHRNEKLELFSQRTYDIQNFGNERCLSLITKRTMMLGQPMLASFARQCVNHVLSKGLSHSSKFQRFLSTALRAFELTL